MWRVPGPGPVGSHAAERRVVGHHRTRAVIPLVVTQLRAISWAPLLAVTPLVPVLGGLLRLADAGVSPGTALVLLRTTGLLLAAGAAFTLTDDMADVAGALPSPRWLRQWLRTGLAFGFAALAWSGTYLMLSGWSTGPPPPFRETALVAAVCVGVGLAGSSVAVRFMPRHGAGASTSLLAGLFLASLFLPEPWSVWPGLDAPQWRAVHLGWSVAGTLPLLTLALSHRDIR